MSLTRPIKPGRLEFQVHSHSPHGRHKFLGTCFFCGKSITRKGDLDHAPVISDGSETKVPSCHSCFLTLKKRPGLLWDTVKARVPASGLTYHTLECYQKHKP